MLLCTPIEVAAAEDEDASHLKTAIEPHLLLQSYARSVINGVMPQLNAGIGDNPADYITFASFCQALRQLGLSGHPNGLSAENIEDLWIEADGDRNGLVDYREFQKRIWNPKYLEEPDQESKEMSKSSQCVCAKNQAFGFNVEDAALFPPEVEKGMWPENYTLSDHAPLTVVFSPVKVSCSQSLC
ncbi:hypothetical protein M5K25_026418 [Dendrobium thyrsiflorum]|uniref:Uncharacterized protein n=1 Tax=Dendrobium thyrsiflorum TaxID=117978 RepID=A0ABD0TX82_DENTH